MVSPALLHRIQQSAAAEATKKAAAPTPASAKAPELKSGYKAPAKGDAKGPAAKPAIKNDVAAQRALAHTNGARGHDHAHGHRHAANDAAQKKPIYVDGSDKNDVISVKNGANGGLLVDVNGKVTKVSAADADRLVIRGKGGDDSVTVDPSVKSGVRIEGGAGNDTITGGNGNDTITGGNGNDKIDGGDGNDVLHGNGGDDQIQGGKGRDIIHGHRGNDALDGGDGQDYVDGGADNDKVLGGNGNDTLIGGKGDDTVDGGKGNDVIAGSSGSDTLIGGEGKNTFYHEASDAKVEANTGDTQTIVDMKKSPGSSIQVKGDADFVDHIEGDLEALRSIPKGRQMLGQMDSTLATRNAERQKADPKAELISVTIEQGSQLQSSFGEGAVGSIENGKMVANKGSSSKITFDPTQTKLYAQDNGWNWSPSSVSLGHELLHSLHSAKGTQLKPGDFSPQLGGTDHNVSATAENEERRTVGLNWNVYDANGDATKKWADMSKGEVTENGLRGDLGIEQRTHY